MIVLNPSLIPATAEGYYEFKLRVKLSDYQATREEFFNVYISDCVITDFVVTADPNRDITYDLG